MRDGCYVRVSTNVGVPVLETAKSMGWVAMDSVWLTIVLLLSMGARSGWADEDYLTDDELVIRTEGAHQLFLPKDWPVEDRETLLVPVPVESYLSMKFGQVRAQFKATKLHLESIDRRLRELEQVHKLLQIRLRSLEANEETGG